MDAEVRAGTAPDRIAIGGFSQVVACGDRAAGHKTALPGAVAGAQCGAAQGGHISLKYLLRAKQPPAACIALSTWQEPNSLQVNSIIPVLQ